MSTPWNLIMITFLDILPAQISPLKHKEIFLTFWAYDYHFCSPIGQKSLNFILKYQWLVNPFIVPSSLILFVLLDYFYCLTCFKCCSLTARLRWRGLRKIIFLLLFLFVSKKLFHWRPKDGVESVLLRKFPQDLWHFLAAIEIMYISINQFHEKVHDADLRTFSYTLDLETFILWFGATIEFKKKCV